MRRKLLFIFLLVIAGLIPAYAQLYSDLDPLEKVEIYNYDTASATWNLNISRKWYWHDSVIVNINDFRGSDPVMPVTRKRYTFNSQKNPLEIITEEYDSVNGNWLLFARQTYTYDTKDRLTENIFYDKSGNPSYKYYYYYFGDGTQVISYNTYNWLKSKQDWYKSGVATKKYNDKSQETENHWLGYDTSGVFNGEYSNFLTIYNSYDSVESQTSSAKSNYYDFGTSHKKYFYDANHILLRVESSSDVWEEGEILESINYYYYNEDGKVKQIVTNYPNTGTYSFESHDYENNGQKHIITTFEPRNLTDSLDTGIGYGSRTILYYATDLAVNDLKPSPNDMSVSPNPCQKNGEIHVILPEISSGSVDFLFYDMQGRLLYSVNYSDSLKNYTIPCPDVPSGAYFIRAVSDGKDVGTGKVVLH